MWRACTRFLADVVHNVCGDQVSGLTERIDKLIERIARKEEESNRRERVSRALSANASQHSPSSSQSDRSFEPSPLPCCPSSNSQCVNVLPQGTAMDAAKPRPAAQQSAMAWLEDEMQI